MENGAFWNFSIPSPSNLSTPALALDPRHWKAGCVPDTPTCQRPSLLAQASECGKVFHKMDFLFLGPTWLKEKDSSERERRKNRMITERERERDWCG